MYVDSKIWASSHGSSKLVILVVMQALLSWFTWPAAAAPEDTLDSVWRDIYHSWSEKHCSWSSFKSDSGKRTGFVRCGNGNKPVIILPGYTEPAKKYMESVLDLSLRRPDLGPIYVMELPGQGTSERLGSSAVQVHVDRDTRYADDLQTFLGIEGLKEGQSKPIIIAHSTGAIVAFAVAARNSEVFDRIIALSPLVRPNLPLPPWAVEIIASMYVKFGFEQTPVWGQSSKPIDDLTFEKNRSTPSKPRWTISHTLLREEPSLFTNGISWAWLKAVISEGNFILKAKDQIKLPILVIRPDNDFYVNVQEGDRFCLSMPNCLIKNIPGDMHETLQLRDPERNQTLNWIIDFIGSRTGR